MDKYVHWIALINARNVGPTTFWKMLEKYGSAEEAIKNEQINVNYKEAENVYQRYCNNIIFSDDVHYPTHLRRLQNRPPILFYKGNKDILKNTTLGIIGARNSSINGCKIAYDMAQSLSNHYAIASGMARGIDASAHRGSLTSPAKTIAVLPLGIEVVYPPENKKVYNEIIENGVVISEYIRQDNTNNGIFHARNRIVSGICRALIIIEAANKSGTLQTANMALDIGCDIFVVPGSPLDPRSHGGNGLIKNGAPLVENYMDVLDLIEHHNADTHDQGYNTEVTHEKQHRDTSDTEHTILSLLDHTPIPIDLITSKTQLSVSEVLRTISVLEIKQKIERHGMNMVALR